MLTLYSLHYLFLFVRTIHILTCVRLQHKSSPSLCDAIIKSVHFGQGLTAFSFRSSSGTIYLVLYGRFKPYAEMAFKSLAAAAVALGGALAVTGPTSANNGSTPTYTESDGTTIHYVTVGKGGHEFQVSYSTWPTHSLD